MLRGSRLLLIDPHAIDLVSLGKPGFRWVSAVTADGEIEPDPVRRAEWIDRQPMEIDGFGEIHTGEQSAVEMDPDFILAPLHDPEMELVVASLGIECTDRAFRCVPQVAPATACLYGVGEDRPVMVFHDVDLTLVGPTTVTSGSPDGGPQAGKRGKAREFQIARISRQVSPV